MVQFTIVTPMRNEAGNIAALVEGIGAACAPLGPFELVIVNDGSDDATEAQAVELGRTRPWLRVLSHPQAGGQSAAIHSGVLAARGAIVATLDGDGQNPPAELPKLLAPLLAAGADPRLGLVAGQRVGRRDTLSKRLASRLANAIRAAALGDATRDTGCGLKAFRREAYLALPYFNHQHRYLPALFARDGWRVAHVDVAHAPRGAGRSNYTNFGRALVGVLDLAGVAWLIKRRKRVRAAEIATGGARDDRD